MIQRAVMMVGLSKFIRRYLLLGFITANPSSFLGVTDWQDNVNHNCIYVVHTEWLSFTWGLESEMAELNIFITKESCDIKCVGDITLLRFIFIYFLHSQMMLESCSMLLVLKQKNEILKLMLIFQFNLNCHIVVLFILFFCKENGCIKL